MAYVASRADLPKAVYFVLFAQQRHAAAPLPPVVSRKSR